MHYILGLRPIIRLPYFLLLLLELIDWREGRGKQYLTVLGLKTDLPYTYRRMSTWTFLCKPPPLTVSVLLVKLSTLLLICLTLLDHPTYPQEILLRIARPLAPLPASLRLSLA